MKIEQLGDDEIPMALTRREIWAIVFATEYAETDPMGNQAYKDILRFIRVKIQSAMIVWNDTQNEDN